MMIKVCGITRQEDAGVAAEAGASAIGFIFYPPSPRCITPERAAALGEGLDLWKVGIFVDETPAAIAAVMRAANLDVAQIYGGGAPAGARIWKAFRIADSFDGALGEGCEAVFLDSAKNGMSFDWKLARNAAAKVIVAGGLDASNVAEAIDAAKPWGVDASSKLESAPGIKDHDRVRAFVKAAREATW
ncbi:MAG: phosphoribosylanthranilate isomerase [Acidobacteriota bacterium]